ncbi:hypothetical protein CDR68_12640 [Salmonella enterica]|nr:hypothetical protein [Salmonella enterica]
MGPLAAIRIRQIAFIPATMLSLTYWYTALGLWCTAGIIWLTLYTLHTSSCLCVGYARSPQSHSYLCSWGLTPLPPLSNSNYFGYILIF